MTDTKIPDAISHLDFDLDTEEKKEEAHSCQMPITRHPVTDDVVRCGARANYKIDFSVTCACQAIVVYFCQACWSGFVSNTLRVQCLKHKQNIDPAMVSGVTPLK